MIYCLKLPPIYHGIPIRARVKQANMIELPRAYLEVDSDLTV